MAAKLINPYNIQSTNITIIRSLDEKIGSLTEFKPPRACDQVGFATCVLQKQPLSYADSDFMVRDDGFISLVKGQENSWLDGLVERAIAAFFPHKVVYDFWRRDCKAADPANQSTGYFHHSRTAFEK